MALYQLSKNGWSNIKIKSKKPITHIVLSERTDKAILVAREDGKPAEWSLYKNRKMNIFYNTDKTGLPDGAFARYSSFFVTSFDGTKIPTHILRPKNATKEHLLLMLVWAHVGPQDHDDARYSGLK